MTVKQMSEQVNRSPDYNLTTKPLELRINNRLNRRIIT
jgi:hypothetical protein